MLKTYRPFVMIACVLASAPCVLADDAATAAGLVGAWEGKWEFADLSGKPTMDFEVTLSEDGSTMVGTWTSPVATGKVTLARKK